MRQVEYIYYMPQRIRLMYAVPEQGVFARCQRELGKVYQAVWAPHWRVTTVVRRLIQREY